MKFPQLWGGGGINDQRFGFLKKNCHYFVCPKIHFYELCCGLSSEEFGVLLQLESLLGIIPKWACLLPGKVASDNTVMT